MIVRVDGSEKLVFTGVLFGMFTYLGVPQQLFIILCILIVLDIVGGVLRELIIEPQRVLSQRFISGIMTKFLIIFPPLILALLGVAIEGIETGVWNIATIWINKFFISALIIGEAYSAIGNYTQAIKRERIEFEYDAVAQTLMLIQKYIRFYIEKFFDKFK